MQKLAFERGGGGIIFCVHNFLELGVNCIGFSMFLYPYISMTLGVGNHHFLDSLLL